MGRILTCYERTGGTAPHRVTEHSTKAQSMSMALLKDIPTAEIYKDCNWSSLYTFAEHYANLPASRDDIAFGDIVLQTVVELPPWYPSLL